MRKSVIINKNKFCELGYTKENSAKFLYINSDEVLAQSYILGALGYYLDQFFDHGEPDWEFPLDLHNNIVFNNMIYSAIQELNKLDKDYYDVEPAVQELLTFVRPKESTVYYQPKMYFRHPELRNVDPIWEL
ncbi:MAG: hypothetical protein MJZ34_14485 [Paludibacteraceae bacterium]|nr:hypothetical protein [Paludibacteraceae bacterium]